MILDGLGRLGFRRTAAARADQQLTGWYTTWAPHLPGLPADSARLVRIAAGDDDRSAVAAALDAADRRAAEQAHPEHAELIATADAAGRTHDAAQGELARARNDHDNRFGTSDRAAYAHQLADVERDLAATRHQLTDARARITALQADPILRAQPPERLQREVQAWRARCDAAHRGAQTNPKPRPPADRAVRRPRPGDLRYLAPHRTPGRDIGR